MIIYCSLLRSTIEYAAPVYAHFITKEQSDLLERLQSQTLKQIYEYQTSYEECLRLSGQERLDERRNKLVIKFTKKVCADLRWEDWFPLHEEYSHDLRRKLVYREEFSSKERLRISPVFAMRRIINQI